MKKLFRSITLVIGVCLIHSCHQPAEVAADKSASALRQSTDDTKNYTDLSVKGDYEVRNGIFYFKDAATFLALDKTLRGESINKQIEFSKKLGFTSLLEIQTTVYNLLGEADNSNKYNAILLSNKDIFQLKGDYIKSFFSDLSNTLLNREGMVSIGGNIHCYAQDKTIIAPNVEKARKAFKTGEKSDGTIILLQNTKNAKARIAITGCGTLDRTAQSSDGSRDVRCEVSILRRAILTSSDPYNGNKYTLDYYANVVGTPRKKNFLG